MRVLHAFNAPRSGGGSLAGSRATIEVCRRRGLDVEVFTRDSRELARGVQGRVSAALAAVRPPPAVTDFERVLERFRPDLVHANELFPFVSPWILPACTARGVRIVLTCDDYHYTCPARNHFRAGRVCTECLGGNEMKAVLRNCKGTLGESVVNAVYNARVRRSRLVQRHVAQYVTPSDFTGRWLVDHFGVEAARVVTIPHVIDLPAEPVANPAAGCYVAYAGRFVPEKGIDVLLAAARATALPVKLSRNEQHFTTIALPAGTAVVVTRGRDDLAAFYRGARFLVFPSVWFESFGIVGAEAMSHGIPVIGSRLGAVEGLIEDGVDGLLFRAGDASDLAAKMQRLWNDADLCRRLGEGARRKAQTRFGEVAHFAALMATYERALSMPPPAG